MPRISAFVCAAVLIGVIAMIGKMWWDSRLPGTYSVMDYGHADYGGGAESDPHAAHDGRERGLSVTALHGPRAGSPDARFALAARAPTVHLAFGEQSTR